MRSSKKLIAFIILTVAIMISGCSSNKTEEQKQLDKYTEISRTVALTDNERNTLKAEMLMFIGGSEASDLETFDNSVKIIGSDILTGPLNFSYKTYWFNGACYIQIKDSMYRFQLDSNKQVKSYIKYKVVA